MRLRILRQAVLGARCRSRASKRARIGIASFDASLAWAFSVAFQLSRSAGLARDWLPIALDYLMAVLLVVAVCAELVGEA